MKMGYCLASSVGAIGTPGYNQSIVDWVQQAAPNHGILSHQERISLASLWRCEEYALFLFLPYSAKPGQTHVRFRNRRIQEVRKEEAMESQKAIAIYTRESKFTGKGESIGNQVEVCRDYVSRVMCPKDAENCVVHFTMAGHYFFTTEDDIARLYEVTDGLERP